MPKNDEIVYPDRIAAIQKAAATIRKEKDPQRAEQAHANVIKTAMAQEGQKRAPR